jgi:hypothetical protein
MARTLVSGTRDIAGEIREVSVGEERVYRLQGRVE